MGPTGELFEPMGALTHDEAFEVFKLQAEALAEGGVDILWVETLSSMEEVKAAVEQDRKGLDVAVCMTFDTAARSMMGVTPADFAQQTVEYGASYVGANCRIGRPSCCIRYRESCRTPAFL